jgi:hypothetical protein
MFEQRLSIAFEGRTVIVDSDSAVVLERVRHRFKALETTNAEGAAMRFEVKLEGHAPYFFWNGSNRIDCESLSHLIGRLTYEIALDLIEARPDLLWLHAASASLDGKAVALAGESGRGKSTIVTGLCSRGWSFMSDDISPLDPATGMLIPFALAPEVRRNPGVALPADHVRNLKKTGVPVEPERVCRQSVPIRGLIFPRFEPGVPARLVPCSPAEAAMQLLPCCLNFVRHREAAVRYVCELVQKIPVFHLSFSNSQDAVELLCHQKMTLL